MKQRTINHLLAVLCMLLLGVGSAYAQNSSNIYLEIGGYSITDENKDDIIKAITTYWNQTNTNPGGSVDGKILYNSTTNTLTLRDCQLELNSNYSLLVNISSKPLNLNLEGTNIIKYNCSATEGVVDYHYGFRGSVVIKGNGTLKADFSTDNKLEFRESESLTVSGEYSGEFIEISRIREFYSENNQNIAQDIIVPDDYMMLMHNVSSNNTPEYYHNYLIKANEYHYKNPDSYVWLRIQPVTKYNLYVADTQANWKNEDNILGNGTVSYNKNSNTLTLNNANINYQQGQGQQPAVFYYSNTSSDGTEGVNASTLKVNLKGTNILVSNATYGFNQGCTLVGDGNLNFVNPTRVFGGKVNLGETFTGWVGARSDSYIKGLNIGFPNTTDYFLARVSQLDQPLSAQTISETTSLQEIYRQVRFGKKDGSADPTLTLNGALGDKAHVGIALPENTHQAIVSNGHAPFYYTASNLPAGLTIDPNTGYISGKYTMSRDGNYRTTIKVHDLEGREGVYNVDIPVKPAMSFTSEANFELPDNMMVRGINPNIDIQCGLAKYMANYEAPRTFTAVGLPEGMTITSGGEISGTPTAIKPENTKATITVTDAIGQTASIDINVGRVFENYEFNVAGTLVTGINKYDILGTSGNKGVCSYDYATKTLVLNNFHYTGEASTLIDDANDAVENIHVIGENSINMTGTVVTPGSFLIKHDINVTGSISGNVLPKLLCNVDNDYHARMYGVQGNVTVIDDVVLDIYAPAGAIIGNLNIPANQQIYTGNSENKADAVAHNETSYKIGTNTRMVFTSRLENGALRFTNKNEGKTVFNTIPVKPFTMFDVEGGVAPYTYSVSALPSGLTFDTATGTISGTSVLNSSSTSVTFTVTDGMAREVSTEIDWVVKNPTLTMKECGGTTDRTATNRNWGVVLNTAGKLQKGQLLLVDTDFDFEETLLTIPNNMVVRDVNGKTYANNITLKDGVKYAFPYEVDANSISYTREFSTTQAGTWQALYVPFDITITEELLKDFSFAKLYMMSYKDTNENGEIEDGEPLVMLLSRQHAGKVLHANTPYFISAKTAGTKSIEVESATLKPAKNGTVYCCTTEHEYTLTGIYEPTYMQGKYGMSNQGNFIYITSSTTKLNPNRWYLEINSRNGEETESVAEARQIFIMVDGEDDTTGVMNITSSSKTSAPEGIFTLDGRRVKETEKLPRGIYIKNGKKIMVK